MTGSKENEPTNTERMGDGQPKLRAMNRFPVVGVMGSGSQEHRERSEPLGRWLAGLGVHLLTGGGAGVMAAVSESFASTRGRRGSVVGILPAHASGDSSMAGYPNPWVEIAIRTHLPLTGDRGLDPMSRNHINVLSSDVIVALSGGAGTASEVSLALRYGRPVVVWLDARNPIPGPSPGAQVARTFHEVQRFVEEALGVEDIEGRGGS